MKTATVCLLGVLVCVGLASAADGNDRGGGLFIPDAEDGFNGGRGRAWNDDAGRQPKKKSRSNAKPAAAAADRDETQQQDAAGDDSAASWIPGISQPWILIPATLGGLCLVLAPVWFVVRRVRSRRAPQNGRARSARQPALATSLVHIRLNQARSAETAAPEAQPARRAA